MKVDNLWKDGTRYSFHATLTDVTAVDYKELHEDFLQAARRSLA